MSPSSHHSHGAFPRSKARLVIGLCALLLGQLTADPGWGQSPNPFRQDQTSAAPPGPEVVPIPEPLAHPYGLSLSDLEDMAAANNPTLAVAWARINAARGRQLQSGLYPNPMVGYIAEDIGEDGTAGQHGGYVSQQFITGKKLKLNVAMGSREVKEQRFLFNAQELRVFNDVRLRYYDALAAQRRVELNAELTQISIKLADNSRQLLEAQQVAKSDLLQAEIEVEEAQIQSANAQNEWQEAWRRLAAVVGIPCLEVTPLLGALDGDLPTYAWDDVYCTVVAQNPEVAAAAARVERARIAITRARRENIPDVTVMTMVTHMTQTGDDVVGVQAGIPIPMLNQNQGNIAAAQAELVAAANNYERIQLDLQDRLAMTFRRYANARQQVDRYREEILPRAEESIELVRTGYREGQVAFLDLLTSQRTYIRVNVAYVDALAELRQAATLIDGQLLSDSLKAE
jgi:cobalt-zinc-cadmium efflux system outer membrane protein